MDLVHHARTAGRLSQILREELGVSAGLMNRLKWKDMILVNGQPRHTDYPVQPGDEVRLLLDERTPEYPAEEMDLSILYEDENLLAVDKPPRMLIHPSRHRDSGTLANGVVWHYAQTNQHCAFHPVTRLDRDTFGVTLIAKNSHVHALMQRVALEKTYHALVFGSPERDAGVIDAPIDRLPLPSLLRCVAETGKPSVTNYRVLTRWTSHALVELKPITGRTHQLRVHCAYIGHPILGDPQYGTAESTAYSQSLGYDYQRLCAKTLSFVHPITGEKIVVESRLNP